MCAEIFSFGHLHNNFQLHGSDKFLFRGYKVHVVWFLVKDRQVQHNFRESRHQCSSCPNFACHKCLARESNPRHLCSKQSILPLDHHSRIKLELGNSNDILQARNLSSSCKPQPCSQVLLLQGTGPLTVQGLSKLGKLSRSLGDPVRIPRVLQPDFVFRGYKVHVVWF